MAFVNTTTRGVNRKDARRQRAAERLQSRGRLFDVWDEHAKVRLESRLQEFLGLCRSGAISQQNVYGVAANILSPVVKIMGKQNHQFWLAKFNEQGQRVFNRGPNF